MSSNHASNTRNWNRLNTSVVKCKACPRLIEHCQEIAKIKRRAFIDEQYWGKPVANFGDPRAELLIVGLAPGAHGANRTGRIFTGDRSGEWLYRALHLAGFANQRESTHTNDGLELFNCAITNVCHCAPPLNRPTHEEIQNCQPWLTQLVAILPVKVFLAFGQIAWRATAEYLRHHDLYDGPLPKFSHGAMFHLPDGRILLGSYHPSQQNTFTGRLTRPMLNRIFKTAKRLLC
ncbi:MAG: uracil-DNA glycosylase [Planctomycetaceae bacterium]|nr:uracil-DNA glycosylase [Planctomycetaceae bacterium]